MNWRVERFGTLPSTNDVALERLRSGDARAGDVIVAAAQSAGRGRPGRSWHSPEGALLMTAVLPFHPDRVGWTALAAGAAVARAVRALGAPAGVKWPNDVVAGGRKLGGVLAETTGGDLVAVGIGLNVLNPLPDDPEVAVRSIGLADLLPSPTVDAVLEAVLDQLDRHWQLLAAGTDLLRRAWEELDTTAGRAVEWAQGGVTGIAEGVDPSGALLIRAADGRIHTAVAGEVRFVRDCATIPPERNVPHGSEFSSRAPAHRRRPRRPGRP